MWPGLCQDQVQGQLSSGFHSCLAEVSKLQSKSRTFSHFNNKLIFSKHFIWFFFEVSVHYSQNYSEASTHFVNTKSFADGYKDLVDGIENSGIISINEYCFHTVKYRLSIAMHRNLHQDKPRRGEKSSARWWSRLQQDWNFLFSYRQDLCQWLPKLHDLLIPRLSRRSTRTMVGSWCTADGRLSVSAPRNSDFENIIQRFTMKTTYNLELIDRYWRNFIFEEIKSR